LDKHLELEDEVGIGIDTFKIAKKGQTAYAFPPTLATSCTQGLQQFIYNVTAQTPDQSLPMWNF